MFKYILYNREGISHKHVELITLKGESVLQLRMLDFNDFFVEDNIIVNHEPVDSKTKKFNSDGIFSETIFGKLGHDGIQYTCDCGKYKGKFYLDKECEECMTKVRFVEPLINRIGWIYFGDEQYIIHPNLYNFVARIIPRSELLKILTYDRRISKDGKIIKEDNDDPKTKYHGIGITEFRKRFDEIIQYYQSKSKDRNEFLEIINKYRDILFINKLPVFSPILRPAVMIGENFIFDEINNLDNMLIQNSNTIRELIENGQNELHTEPLLTTMQFNSNQIWEKIIDNLRGKNGIIRGNILGSRTNFSGRCVITPLPAGYAIDELVVPYLTFLELYKYHILNVLMAVRNINYVEANNIWANAATHFDPEVYSIMNEILTKTKGGLKVLLNRNPSINFGSIMCLRIAGIKKDYDDLTISLSNNILAPMGGDYDGDTLNIIPLMDNALKDAFKVFNPKQMIIDPNDGKFNQALSIDRDHVLGIHSLNQRRKK